MQTQNADSTLHNCGRSLGCLDPQCVLCEHNPHRRCNVNFAPKYLVNDVLKAKCEAPIRVEIIDRSTGVPVGEDIPDVHLEVLCRTADAVLPVSTTWEECSAFPIKTSSSVTCCPGSCVCSQKGASHSAQQGGST